MSRWLPVVMIPLALAMAFIARPSGAKCVQIYYDRAPKVKPRFYFGRIHALYLQNLLGHFPRYQQYIRPIELYHKGDIDSCNATIYLGTYYDNAIPRDFIDDFAESKKPVLWAGYNVWQLGAPMLDALWGVKFDGLSRLDLDHRDDKGRPAFYKYYEYKGETFEKYGEFDPKIKNRFNAAYEITLLSLTSPDARRNVRSWARHSYTSAKTPYVVENDNHWYVADSPFAFMTESDRMLIFADLLFDLLSEKPRYEMGKKPALVRVEDIHPKISLWSLYQIANFMMREKSPYTMSIIPIYVDPHKVETPGDTGAYSTVIDNPYFVEFLKYAGNHGASYVLHGVTHQYRDVPNPFSGLTGDDFEFWDRNRNRPIAEDSPEFVVNRIEDGYGLFEATGIRPLGWLTPHYQASPLDYIIFGQLFYWNVGRVIYFPFHATQSRRLPESLTLEDTGRRGNGKRLQYFKDLKVEYPEDLLPAGQLFPYEIYGDAYGQRLIPEDAGNLQPYLDEQVLKTESIDDMIATLRRNRVIRDAWGSFFIHLYAFLEKSNAGIGEYPGDLRELKRLLQAGREAGYQFVDLKEWTRTHRGPIRPAPIEEDIP